ncbi:unnamed protein product [Amoebophrya sp. A120]|nr:unnamed protein product [Amoebophrya sp. A120]|eukprot:GSA120T00004960001.1
MGFLWVFAEFRLIERCGAYSVAIFGNINRILAIVFAVAVLRESFAYWQFIGILVIVFGVYLRFSFGTVRIRTVEERLDKLPETLREDLDDDAIQVVTAKNFVLADQDLGGVPVGGEIRSLQRQVTSELLRQVTANTTLSELSSRQLSRERSGGGAMLLRELTRERSGNPMPPHRQRSRERTSVLPT